MANYIDPWRMDRIRTAFASGFSIRETAKYAGVAPQTAKRWKGVWKDFDQPCNCGKHGGHNGWCATRLARHPKRQKWLEDQGWTRRSKPRQSRVLILQALSVIEPQTNELLADMTGLNISGVAAVTGTMYFDRLIQRRIVQGLAWFAINESVFADFDDTQAALRRQAVEYAATYQERRQWQEGKRTLAQLKKWLHDRPDLRPSPSPQGPNSPHS